MSLPGFIRRNWRLKVTVTEEGGQYKMSKLEFVP